MGDWNLQEVVERISFLTKENWTQFKYVRHSGNLTYDVDACVTRMIFGTEVPFRIVKNSDRQSVDIERERLLNFVVQADLLRSEGHSDYLKLMSEMQPGEYMLPKPQQVHINGLKKLAKSSRINEDNLLTQLLYQCVYDTTFKFTSLEEKDRFVQNYFDEYIIEDLSQRVSFALENHFIIEACQLFARNISRRLSKALQSFHMEAPVVSGKHSPMGPKSEDQYRITELIATGQVWTGVRHNVEMRRNLMSLLGYSTRVFDAINWTDSFNEESLQAFSPKVNGIESTEFKPRIIYQSNDLDDCLLDPFMRFLRLCESFCKCSFSTFRPNDERLNSKYSVARMVSENALDMLHCGESNSDLTMATDKLSGDLECEMVLTFIRALSPEVRNQMDDLGLTEQYFIGCFELINHSMVWTKFSNGIIRTGYCRCGQSQGERGSFHNLHFQNMMFGLASFLMEGLGYNEWETTSIYQGDDADIPDIVQPHYAQLWISHSLPGVASLDKTASEASEGALLFCKSYIKTGKASPRIINGLKFNQLMRIFNDPQQMNDFVSYDIFQDRLIGRIRSVVQDIKNRYDRFGVLPTYVESAYDIATRNRLRHWNAAHKVASHLMMTLVFNPIFSADIKYEAQKGLVPALSPLQRAKNLIVRNDFISYDVYLGAIALQRFTTILNEQSTIEHPLKGINEFFSEMRIQYVIHGEIPMNDHRVPDVIWEKLLMILRFGGVPRGNYTITDATETLNKAYDLVYRGYSNGSHVVKVYVDLR